jgi:two-component system NtrC family response regulator
MPDMDGLEVLHRLRAQGSASPPVAVLTAYASAANTIEAMRLGAFDHLTKPIGREDLASLVTRMLRSRDDADATEPAPAADDQELVGSSAAMREVQKTIGLVADSDAIVLITGETGTGKEMVAQAIHRYGRRGRRPFVAVSCAAIPDELLESELFGHTRGAFTGAVSDRNGAFRDAEAGTLFLDEVGDMDVAMQAKILRALQERMVTPVGGRPVRVDVRVLAATHRDLAVAVRERTFREDLFYRLNVVPIYLPPLRERLADIVPLAERFLRQVAATKRLTAEAAARLLAHPWPGNVRELKNAIERAAVLGRSETVTGADLAFLDAASSVPGGKDATDWTAGDLPTAIERLESHMIARALRETGGNRSEAAKRLDVHRQLLYAKIQKYGLSDVASAYWTEGVLKPDK